MPTTPRRLLREMLEKHGPLIEEAFLSAVAEVVNGAGVKAIADALSRADYDRAIDILGLTEEAFETVGESVRNSYVGSGRSVSGWIDKVSDAEIKLLFKPGDPIAAEWLRTKSSSLVTRITEGQRISIREALSDGMEAGRNPRSVTLDIIGRRPRGANARQGGLVGLTRDQAQRVQRVRSDLLSGDPARMRKYLKMQLRDRRFDRTVARAIKAGTPLTRTEVDRIAGRLADRTLQWRGEAIARTETTQAFHAAQDHAFGQGIGSGHLPADKVTKTWRSANDERVRFSHSALNGVTLPMNEVFVSPIGSMMKHPGDTSLGAVPGDIIQCRCRLTYEVIE
ncbi:MAG: phage minor head protein [Pseudomonadota bacterium]